MESLEIVYLLLVIIVISPIVIQKYFILFKKENNIEIYLFIKAELFKQELTIEQIKFLLIKKYGLEPFEALQCITAAQSDDYELFKLMI